MTIIQILYNQIYLDYKNKYTEILNNYIEQITKNYYNYVSFINKNFKFNSNNLINKKEKLQFQKILNKINNFIKQNKIHDTIMFLTLLKEYSIKIKISTCYIPNQLKQKTKNNILSFITKDIKLNKIDIIELSINNFSINNIAYVFIRNNFIRYNISNFIIKIVKKKFINKYATQEGYN